MTRTGRDHPVTSPEVPLSAGLVSLAAVNTKHLNKIIVQFWSNVGVIFIHLKLWVAVSYLPIFEVADTTL